MSLFSRLTGQPKSEEEEQDTADLLAAANDQELALLCYDYDREDGQHFALDESNGSPNLVKHYQGVAMESLQLADFYRTHPL
jgi:hypothetical protein